MSDWIDCSKELPPRDGHYCVSNHYVAPEWDFGVCEYDGIGFKYNNIYRPVTFWKYCEPINKKYGKINESLD